jgi:hypothetical protein
MTCFNHEESPEPRLQSSEGAPNSGVAGESRMAAPEQLQENPAVKTTGEKSDQLSDSPAEDSAIGAANRIPAPLL